MIDISEQCRQHHQYTKGSIDCHVHLLREIFSFFAQILQGDTTIKITKNQQPVKSLNDNFRKEGIIK